MQSVSSRFWTRVAVFISYDDNDYTRVVVPDKGPIYWLNRTKLEFTGFGI